MADSRTNGSGLDTSGRTSTDNKAGSEQSSAFQMAVAAWRNIDLTSLQKTLDNAANDIVSSQRDALVERKEVAQKTKEFRKLDEEGRTNEWKGLLKSYQTYIDHLTNSKKATESAFLSLYNSLSEAPDPYPLLEATIDSLVSATDVNRLTEENNSLKTTIARLNNQVANLENTLQTTKSELRSREDDADKERSNVEEQWKGLLEERTMNWEAKEKVYGEKVADLEGLVRDLRASYEVAQRTGGSQNDEELQSAGRLAELDVVSRDLERMTQRLAEVETRNEELRLELVKAKSDDHDLVSAQELEDQKTETARHRSENLTLMRKVEVLESQINDTQLDQKRKIEKLERLLDGITKDKDILKEKLSKCADYEEVKRELEILKSIEFSTGDDDEDTFADEEPQTPSGGKKETLEQLLLARNKKLSSELTILRVSHQDLTNRLQSLQDRLDRTSAQLTDSKRLNVRLEEDLTKLQSDPFSSAHSVAPSRYAPSHAGQSYRTGRISPTSSIISGIIPHAHSTDNLSGSGSAILPMITAQRDRFKQKNSELENELAKAQISINSLKQEVANLQRDNMQLYEKTRYVSSYNRHNSSVAQTSATSSYATNPNPSSVQIDRYKAAYEQNISPFQAFRGRETARAMKKMGLAERVVYGLTRVILANRMTRNLFVGYCLFLHFLVILTLYYSSSTRIAETPGIVGDIGKAADTPGDWREEPYPGGR